MPNYRFRISHQNPEQGRGDVVNLSDEKAAWDEATTACGEMIADLDGCLPEGSDWSMEVSDDMGPLFRITFGAVRLRAPSAESVSNESSNAVQLPNPEDPGPPSADPRPTA